MVGAKFSVKGKLTGDGVSGKADELRRARFDIGAARSTKRHPTKIVVAELRGEWQRYGKMGGGNFGEKFDVDVLSIGGTWRFR